MSSISRENRKAYEYFAGTCVHGALPSCSAFCPLNLDMREIVGHVQEGDFTAAYKAYRVKAVFPEIVASVCDEPCKAGCVRKELDQSVSLRRLERACVDFARVKSIPSFNLPPKKGKIIVVGAGLSGLTCAVRLASKSHPVTLYEKSDRIGGRLWDLMDAGVFLPSIMAQLDATACAVRLETQVTCLSDMEHDVVVVATGEGGNTWGLLDGIDPQSFGTEQSGVFVIGNIRGTTPVEDIAQGRIAAFSVEKYLKVGAMDGMPETFRQTHSPLVMDLSRVESGGAVVPKSGEVYDEQEAVAEACRCLLCDCTICAEGCEFFDAVRKMPRQLVSDAVASLNTRSNCGVTRAISSCNLCGLCGKICPQGIDMGQFCSDFRVFKREDGLLPPVFHQFFLDDMRSANEEAYLARPAPTYEQARYVFFPGCQLGASDPRHVESTYHRLLQRISDMGLILGCCGAPAEWAGEIGLRDSVMEGLTAEWERFGRPEFVFACPTCKLQFERHLPDISGVSLYTFLLDAGLSGREESDVHGDSAGREDPGVLGPVGQSAACVFDPCSSRNDKSMQESVRRIAREFGIRLAELTYSGERAQCCGWGGHMAVANLKLQDMIARNRAAACPLPYITYCANCQEVFARCGKASRHILDIVLGLENQEQRPSSLGRRRKNRMIAKRAVLEKEWGVGVVGSGDTSAHEGGRGTLPVAIPQDLLAKMYDELILEDDVYRTIDYCESTGDVVYDASHDLYIGHLRSGVVTYWVEYAKSDQGLVLRNVFFHRMEIVESRSDASVPTSESLIRSDGTP